MSPKNVPRPALSAKALSEARIRKAINDELTPYGLTFDSPRELWPANTIIHASERMKREKPRPS